MSRTIVVGAGVIGATAALYLARNGIPVTVVDGQAGPGLDTSYANGGLVTPSTAFPWSSPGSLRLLLRYMGREDAPLYLKPSDIVRLGSWGLRFALNCRPSRYSESSRIVSRFASESLTSLTELLKRSNGNYDLQRGGLLQVYRGPGAQASWDGYSAFLDRMGIRFDRLDPAGVVKREPTLSAISETIHGGLLLPDDAWGDAFRFTEMAASAGQDAGAEFLYNTAVTSLVVKNGRVNGIRTGTGEIAGSTIILCTGPRTKTLLAPLGIDLPLYPVKGYSITLRKEDIGFMPRQPIVDDHAHLGVTPLGDRLRVAGTVEFAGFDQSLQPRRIENLKRALLGLYPHLRLPDQISPWAGLRPMMPDGLPVIDSAGVEGLYLNCGHGALGWTLACGSAEKLVQLIVGNRRESDSPFRLNRRFW